MKGVKEYLEKFYPRSGLASLYTRTEIMYSNYTTIYLSGRSTSRKRKIKRIFDL